MKEYFQVDPKIIYLNSGTHSIVPRDVFEAMQAYQRDYERNPTQGLKDAWKNGFWDSHRAIASFFHMRPQDLFLRSNVTLVMNAFILGFPLKTHDEILHGDGEYGSIVNICRLRQRRDGVKLRSLAIPKEPQKIASMTDTDWSRWIVEQLKPETAMVVLSHVVTSTGLKIPIELIAKETARRNVLLVVDGAHAPGSGELDFRALSDVDAYGGNFHKWMMGPKGTSFGWVNPKKQHLIEPIQVSWSTLGSEFSHESIQIPDPTDFALKMLPSACYDFAPFFALKDMIHFWQRLSPQRIWSRLHELGECVVQEFSSRLNWTLVSPQGRYQTPLKTFRAGTVDIDLLYRQTGVQLAGTRVEGRPCVRVSAHIYNSEAEIVEACRRIQSSIGK